MREQRLFEAGNDLAIYAAMVRFSSFFQAAVYVVRYVFKSHVGRHSVVLNNTNIVPLWFFGWFSSRIKGAHVFIFNPFI